MEIRACVRIYSFSRGPSGILRGFFLSLRSVSYHLVSDHDTYNAAVHTTHMATYGYDTYIPYACAMFNAEESTASVLCFSSASGVLLYAFYTLCTKQHSIDCTGKQQTEYHTAVLLLHKHIYIYMIPDAMLLYICLRHILYDIIRRLLCSCCFSHQNRTTSSPVLIAARVVLLHLSLASH